MHSVSPLPKRVCGSHPRARLHHTEIVVVVHYSNAIWRCEWYANRIITLAQRLCVWCVCACFVRWILIVCHVCVQFSFAKSMGICRRPLSTEGLTTVTTLRVMHSHRRELILHSTLSSTKALSMTFLGMINCIVTSYAVCGWKMNEPLGEWCAVCARA